MSDVGEDEFPPPERWRAVLRHHGGAYEDVHAEVHATGAGVFRAWYEGTNWWGEGPSRAAAVTAMAVAYGAAEPYTLAEVVPPGGETLAEVIARLKAVTGIPAAGVMARQGHEPAPAPSRRMLSSAEYVTALTTWCHVLSRAKPMPLYSLSRCMDAVLAQFQDDVPRAIGAYRAVVDATLDAIPALGAGYGANAAELRCLMAHSCLLDRLVDGEPVRRRHCPVHKGRWSGVVPLDLQCPHGCGAPCGCETGWLL